MNASSRHSPPRAGTRNAPAAAGPADATQLASLLRPVVIVDDEPGPVGGADQAPDDPAELMLTCANCGARMDERKCKLICRCGYFLSCSDYY